MSAFWALAARQSWRPFFFRVTSEANIADPISRADCTLAVRHGWTQADTNLEAVLDILAWAADDLEYAVQRAAADLASVSLHFSLFRCRRDAWEGAPDGEHMRPSGPGIWGVCGPPPFTGDFPSVSKSAVAHFWLVLCTVCGMLEGNTCVLDPQAKQQEDANGHRPKWGTEGQGLGIARNQHSGVVLCIAVLLVVEEPGPRQFPYHETLSGTTSRPEPLGEALRA